MNVPDSADKVILCLSCRGRFTEAEIASAARCPACGNGGVPADTRQGHAITLTDHEWRVLFMWAESWAGHCNEGLRVDPSIGMPGVIRGIAAEARRQHPDLPALTFAAELQDLAEEIGATSPAPSDG